MSDINELLKQSKELSENLKKSLDVFEKSVESNLSNQKDVDIDSIEKAKRITRQALELAKKGDVSGINNLLNTFKNGSKDNEAGI